MKLLDILRESTDIDDFLTVVKRERIVVPRQLLLRGLARRSVSTFEMVPVRKDRAPKSTHPLMDGMAEAARLFYKPSLPSRQSSTFVTTSDNYASKYGKVHYVFFRTKANVKWWAHDTYPRYFKSLPQPLPSWNKNTILAEYKSDPKIKNVVKFLDAISLKRERDAMKILVQRFDPVLAEMAILRKTLESRIADEMKIGGIGNKPDIYDLFGVNSALLSWKTALSKSVEYVMNANDYDPSYTGTMADILIDDDSVLVVNRDWFDKNFIIDYGSKEIRRK